jgi:hypothetical protein
VTVLHAYIGSANDRYTVVAAEFGDKRLIDTDPADGNAFEPRWINLARSP